MKKLWNLEVFALPLPALLWLKASWWIQFQIDVLCLQSLQWMNPLVSSAFPLESHVFCWVYVILLHATYVKSVLASNIFMSYAGVHFSQLCLETVDGSVCPLETPQEMVLFSISFAWKYQIVFPPDWRVLWRWGVSSLFSVEAVRRTPLKVALFFKTLLRPPGRLGRGIPNPPVVRCPSQSGRLVDRQRPAARCHFSHCLSVSVDHRFRGHLLYVSLRCRRPRSTAPNWNFIAASAPRARIKLPTRVH